MKRVGLISFIVGILMFGGFLMGMFSFDENELKSKDKYYIYQINSFDNLIPALVTTDLDCIDELIEYHKEKENFRNAINVPLCSSSSVSSNIPVYILDTVRSDVIQIAYFIGEGAAEKYYSGYVYRPLMHGSPKSK